MPATTVEPARKNIVILTGAGISKESGLDTFRCADGIWAKVNLEDVATPEGFHRDPELVHAFYNSRREQLGDPTIQPNAAHLALARLERKWPGKVFVVTQNIDNLHERAGTQNLLHMHGELQRIRCERCRQEFAWHDALTTMTPCPGCTDPGWLRPHVVWFGEMPIDMPRIYEALEDCSLFMSIGTSGNVYPAAGFVMHVRQFTNAHSVELNLEASTGASYFAETIYGPATQSVPAYVDRLLAEGLQAVAPGGGSGPF